MTRTVALLSRVSCASIILLLFGPSSSAQGSGMPSDFGPRITVRAFEAIVDEHLTGALNGLKALAATQAAASSDWSRIKPPLEQFGKSLSTATAVWFARPDGSYLTVEGRPSAGSLRGRDYFPLLLRGRDVIGALVVSKSTGVRSIVVATPIVKDGKVAGALGVSLSAARLAALVADELKLPANVVFYALDPRGMTALHKQTSLIFQFPSDIGDASLRTAVRKMLSEPEGVVRYRFRGARRTVLFRRSQLTRWIFAVGISWGG